MFQRLGQQARTTIFQRHDGVFYAADLGQRVRHALGQSLNLPQPRFLARPQNLVAQQAIDGGRCFLVGRHRFAPRASLRCPIAPTSPAD
jgi:hypothetical protein